MRRHRTLMTTAIARSVRRSFMVSTSFRLDGAAIAGAGRLLPDKAFRQHRLRHVIRRSASPSVRALRLPPEQVVDAIFRTAAPCGGNGPEDERGSAFHVDNSFALPRDGTTASEPGFPCNILGEVMYVLVIASIAHPVFSRRFGVWRCCSPLASVASAQDQPAAKPAGPGVSSATGSPLSSAGAAPQPPASPSPPLRSAIAAAAPSALRLRRTGLLGDSGTLAPQINVRGAPVIKRPPPRVVARHVAPPPTVPPVSAAEQAHRAE